MSDSPRLILVAVLFGRVGSEMSALCRKFTFHDWTKWTVLYQGVTEATNYPVVIQQKTCTKCDEIRRRIEVPYS